MTAALALPGDAAPRARPLAGHLADRGANDARQQSLAAVVTAIAAAAAPIARRLALGALPGDPGAVVGTNDSGDRQKALDIAAHDHMLAALRRTSVRAVLSEEAADVVALDRGGDWDVAIDPIDGSGSIGIGAPLGLLFAVFPAGGTFLRPGREVVAAGYVAFGHSVDMGFSVGRGLDMATLDAAGTFRVTRTGVSLPPAASMIAFNASNYRHFPPGLRRYVDELFDGRQGPRGRDFNMRWLAAAAGELHRILNRGGAFLYPADARPGYRDGHLRLIYEAFPIAFLVEQAGGAATDGVAPILGRTPESLHQTTPLVFGARTEVDEIRRCLTTD